MLMRWHDAPSSNIVKIIFYWLIIWQSCLVLICYGHRSVLGVPHLFALKKETEELFYHGYENYMRHAFPEDELRPLSCKPLTRDRENPNHVEINDVLGNYSITLVDTLSTLAILASSPTGSRRNKPLLLFQNGIKDLVEQYGDGSTGPKGQGKRARGFDLDSKVQVFETVIRGVGGLLSAHLFAVGELPIAGYAPPLEQVLVARAWNETEAAAATGPAGIKWRDGFVYDGQLLRLAYDLGNRLLPAFWTSTGIPYPRVNLRHGIPFHDSSSGNYAPDGQCDPEKEEGSEPTENCSAGAGSLVLEFTVLSRLTGDPRFEELAKRAFWAVWYRRSPIDLVGAGVDAETGIWSHSWTGIGAGIDSFFEYAFKSHVLLSDQPLLQRIRSPSGLDPRSLFAPIPTSEHTAEAFLQVWETAHAAIKRHVYRGTNFQHPHYIQVDLTSGASRGFWVDALSAYYPGLLALSGEVEEAIEYHLMSTAVWARFSALPERYNLATGGIEGGLGWWVGRPEMIESTWYLYRATEDPWYIYVGEMTLQDIKRRCWARCGWTGLQNVLTGEKNDRMETFFLSETAKYLFLLFEPDHPLNKLDAPFVFSTEGHPLIIPRARSFDLYSNLSSPNINNRTCPAQLGPRALTISNIAARGDVYHAGSLARLHLMPEPGQIETQLAEWPIDHPSIAPADVKSPSNWTYYPWTLPLELIPTDAQSSLMPVAPTFELSFPKLENQKSASPPLQRMKDGIMINGVGGLRLSMIQDVPMFVGDDLVTGYRIHAINNVALGKDEKVYLAQKTVYKALNPQDPLFSRVRDATMLDIVVEKGVAPRQNTTKEQQPVREAEIGIQIPAFDAMIDDSAMKAAWNGLINQISDLVRDAQGLAASLPIPIGPSETRAPVQTDSGRLWVSAITATGVGAAPLPDWAEVPFSTGHAKEEALPWHKVYAADELCEEKLPANILKSHEIVLVKRGSCSFSKKLSNMANIRPGKSAFQLVIVVDFDKPEHEVEDGDDVDFGTKAGDSMTRPLLDELQMTSGGLPRQHLLPMVLVNGGKKVYEALKHAKGIGVKRRYSVTSQGIPIANLMLV